MSYTIHSSRGYLQGVEKALITVSCLQQEKVLVFRQRLTGGTMV